MSPDFACRELPHGGIEFDLLGPWSPEAAEAFHESGADRLVANYARGFAARDLRFLVGLPLRELEVLARTIDDLGPVHELGDTLESLAITTGSGTQIDLARLPRLEDVSCDWRQVADSIAETDALERVSLLAYDSQDLQRLAHLRQLRALRMKERPALRTLEGVQQLSWLDTLEIYTAPLHDITALAEVRSPALRALALGGCKQVTELDAVAACEALEELDVSECGAIVSLSPIADLDRLNRLYLYGSTNVLDGDLSPLLGLRRLRDLRMASRRTYTPSLADVKRQLGLED
ncbi:hypothetical protein [Nocardioides alpinus]|uniref:hypothetical protein n=1 Tax=Nocardioides alpinus TaxID=748909 RepID=UPI0011138B15|nr:hypothetical protein [Nocardioides alpinus]